MTSVKWTEEYIAGLLVRKFFRSKCLVVVNHCTWSGSEADLLGVDCSSLKAIEVEIKISRSDLRADATKDKWAKWVPAPTSSRHPYQRLPAMEWPRLIWKHYYCMPATVWEDGLMPSLASPMSGVLTVSDCGRVSVIRRARTNPNAKPISTAGIANLARLASLRLWDALGVPK